MAARSTTAEDNVRARAPAMREQFTASGTNISEWARERGFSVKLTHRILAGDVACRYGESHRIAVALGLKPDVAPPGTPVASATPSRANLDDLKAAS